MRRVRFTLINRLALIPVELVHVFLPLLIAAVVLYFTGGVLAAAGAVAAVFAGVVLFPVLLPRIPTPNFSTKGFILGAAAALPFALARYLGSPDAALWHRAGAALSYLLVFPPVTAFLALNFTGSTPFTSRSGVKREMFAYIPVMAWMFGSGILLSLAVTLVRLMGAS